jgi:hypothetical protein
MTTTPRRKRAVGASTFATLRLRRASRSPSPLPTLEGVTVRLPGKLMPRRLSWLRTGLVTEVGVEDVEPGLLPVQLAPMVTRVTYARNPRSDPRSRQVSLATERETMTLGPKWQTLSAGPRARFRQRRVPVPRNADKREKWYQLTLTSQLSLPKPDPVDPLHQFLLYEHVVVET